MDEFNTDTFDIDTFDIDREIDSAINNEGTINGTPGDDNLTGGTGGSTITGLDGNDNLSGGTGGSNLSGGAGNDVLSGGSGSSTLVGGDGNDNLTGGSGSNNLAGDAGNDTLSGGSGSNVLTGGSGNDILEGGTGGNDFDGGENDDYLVGGTGNNNLTGGSGADTFVFYKVENSGGGTVTINGEVINGDETNRKPINTIADFNTSEGDNIQLDANSFGVAPGDTSTLSFDNNTGVLSVADEPAVEVINGVDSDVLANTAIVEGSGSISSVDSVAVGGDGGNATNSGTGADGADATAENGEVVIGGDGADGTDGILDVYRFFETEKGFHFYTSSEQERDSIQQQSESGELPYSYEGESFAALAEDDDGDPLTGAKPVYRFFNNLTGAHLYTISETEKDNIVGNLPDYNLEGVAYYAYDEPQENTIPLYRLYNGDTGTHFFTSSATEKDNTLDTLSQYSAEGNDGIAFYVLPSE